MQAEVAVDAYWQHYLLSNSAIRAERVAAEKFLWAYEWVYSAITGELEGHAARVDPIELMVHLAKCAPDDMALRYLGAGPVEDYLRRPGADIDAVDRAARRDRRFRMALRCAWFEDSLPSSATKRLRRFGPPL